MLTLLPVNLLSDTEVTNWNHAVQVAPNLYSCSLCADSYDNFIAHSCNPNCNVRILTDFTVQFVANRDIESGESVSFDYNSTEWDMTCQGVDFKCCCQTENCRGWIKGKKYLVY